MYGRDWQEFAGVIGMFLLLISVITVTVWQVNATRRAKLVLAREHTYETLAARSAAAQERAETELRELRTRVDAVERILKEVE